MCAPLAWFIHTVKVAVMKLRILSLLLVVCCLSACAGGNLTQLRDATPVGTPFDKALSGQYKALSEKEAADNRDANAELLAGKGLRAAAGKEVLPEPVGAGTDYHDHKAALSEANSALKALFLTNIRGTQPKESAEVQGLYDCWLVRAAAATPEARTTMCKQEFYNRLSWLRDALQHAPDTAATADAKAASSWLIFFDWDKSVLNTTALKNLRQISEEIIHQHANDKVSLNGHTDTSGDADYNMKLSERRATKVRDLLATYGVPDEWMTVYAFGETDLNVPTPDGVKEPKNRRVEVFAE